MTDREANEVIEFVRAFIAIDNAVCALKEREERSKGCEFCNIEANENTMIEDYGYVVCPYCGRPLKGVDDGTDK